jgi:hypothetical protein
MLNLCMCKEKDCKEHPMTFTKLLLAPVVFLSLGTSVVYNYSKRYIMRIDEPYTQRYEHSLEELKTLSPMFTTWLLLEVFVLKFSHVFCCPTWLVQLIEAF